VYPTPALVVEYTEEGWEYLVEEFALEEAYYDSGWYPGDIAIVDAEGSLRSQGVARVVVYPLQFDGSTSELVAYPELEVTISCSGGRGGLGEPTGPLSRVAGLVLPNYEGGGEREGAPADTGKWDICTSVAACDTLGADYLMIVDGDLMGSIETLAEHRSLWNGYNVAVVSDSTVMVNAGSQAISDEAIKEFISDVYHECEAEHMEDGRIGHVLLVGDARSDAPYDLLPAHEAQINDTLIITTDHWYACVAPLGGNDEYADVMIGRLAVGDVSELEIEASKIRYYEINATQDDEWRRNALLSCGFAYGSDQSCNGSDVEKAASVDAAFEATEMPGYAVDSIHAHLMPGSSCNHKRTLASEMNVEWLESVGYHLVELCAHGWEEGTDTFRPWNADTLQTGDTLTFWMVYSCSPGAYDYVKYESAADCLGERLMHANEMSGAIGFFAASETVGNSWKYLGRHMWRAFFDYDLFTPGEAIACSKLWNQSCAGEKCDHLRYNLLGDPAIDLFLTDSQGYGTSPDYVVRGIDMSATPDLVACGETVHLRARVRNVSNCRVGEPVMVRFQACEPDGSECSRIDSFSVVVPAWGSAVLDLYWEPGAADAGHRGFRVVADPGGEQTELHEDNNAAVIDVGVLPEAAGFPVSLEGDEGLSPVVVDVDNDGDVEIIAAVRTPGRVSARSASGTEEWAFDPFGDQDLRGPVACGDLNGSDTLRVVVCYGDTVAALRGPTGRRAWRMRPRGTGLDSGAVLADVRGGDGHPEVLVTRTWSKTGLPRHEQLAVNGDGSGYWWCGPTLDGYGDDPGPAVGTSGGAADLDGDGLCNAASTHYDTNSMTPTHWLTVLESSTASTADSLWSRDLGCADPVPSCDPVFGDVVATSDGLEVLCGVRSVRCYSSQGSRLWERPVSGCVAGLALGDVNGDGDLETVAATYGSPGDPDDCAGRVWVLDVEGATVDSVVLDYAPKAGPVLADLDGDAPEVLVTSSCFEYLPSDTMRWVSHVDAFTLEGGDLVPSDAFPRPLLFWGELPSSPTVADVDADGLPEVVVVDGDGNLHCVESGDWDGEETPLWSCYQRDERHTGVYETPVSGAYPENTTASWWGGYLMTGDVTIDATSSLVVQPGTTVRTVSNADDQESGADEELTELIVHGDLDVGGDPLRRVVFNSVGGSGEGGEWMGLRLREGSSSTIRNATILHADIGVYAYKTACVTVTDSDILSSGTIGIKCTSDPNAPSDIHLHGNTISGGSAWGIGLDSCEAVVTADTVMDFSAYGMKILHDRGSQVRGNRIALPTVGYLSFSGLYVSDSMADLVIAGNVIGDSLSGLPNRAIDYEASASTDTAMISGNTIIMCAPEDTFKATGMYFYDGKPRVRANTFGGKTLHCAFCVAGESARRPHLGEAAGGVCGSPGDTTLAGRNRVVPYDDPAEWYVWVSAGSDSVMAECNYWDPEPVSGRFYGPVAWKLYLKDDPGGGRGMPAGEPVAEPLPELALLPNSPNPFSPETAFRFGMLAPGTVRLAIYDLAGRCVRTLVDGPASAGWQTAYWDGRSDNGDRVASGVYFCRLEAGARELSRKVVVLR
jgi:hypothetical protein